LLSLWRPLTLADYSAQAITLYAGVATPPGARREREEADVAPPRRAPVSTPASHQTIRQTAAPGVL
jgi:hypothetical protein